MEPKRFADDVQMALAQSTCYTTGGEKHSTKLTSLKETSVGRLPEDVRRADFSNWVEEPDVHIDGVAGWAGVAILMGVVRVEKTSFTEYSTVDCAETAHDKSGYFNEFEMGLGAMDKELYGYLFRLLNHKMKSTAAGAKSGF